MARTLNLTPFGVASINLIAGAGAGLRGQLWYPKSATPIYGRIPPYVTESLDILADRGSDDDLATTLQELDNARQWADMYQRDPSMKNPAWLYAQMSGETGQRRCYVRRIAEEWKSDPVALEGYAVSHDAKLRIEIERHPYWEGADSQSIDFPTEETSGAALRWDYAGPIKGDVAGRLWRLQINDGTGPGLIDRVWLGLRSRRKHYNNAQRFPYLWEIEDASSAGTDCGAPTTDATASPGSGNTKRVVSFATTPGWAKRLTMKQSDAGPILSYETEGDGLAFWLLRYKVDSGTECELQLRWGWYDSSDDDTFVRGPVVEVTNTSWDYAECGLCSIPVMSLRCAPEPLVVANAAVQLWARRTSGSGSLHLDCFSVVPMDEGWFIAKGINTITSSDYLVYGQSPDDLEFCILADTALGEPIHSPDWASWNFRPPNDPHTSNAFSIYGVIARASSAVFTDKARIPNLNYYPRFLNLRGAS